MQEIIDREVAFLKKEDRELFCDLFDILHNPNFKSSDERFSAFQDFSKNVLPDNSKKGQFSSIKVADKFRHLTELCMKISNCKSLIISSDALNIKGLSFNEALDKVVAAHPDWELEGYKLQISEK